MKFNALTRTRRPSFSIMLLLTAGLWLATLSNTTAGLNIHLNFLASTPPTNLVGGGTLEQIVKVAAKNWERAFTDPNDPWDVYLDVKWAPMTIRGRFELYTQGGTPHREKSGIIMFNNTGQVAFFADPTPEDNCEYQTYNEDESDLGGGTINTGRFCTDPTGDAVDHDDLLSLAEHEIGHALGMSDDNIEFRRQVPGNTLEIHRPRPNWGTLTFMTTDHIWLTHVLMFRVGGANERVLISEADILAEAQLSAVAKCNLNPYRHAPYITSAEVSGATLTLRGTNGTSFGHYVLLSSTNQTLPVSKWTRVLTNSFDCRGNFNLSTNIIDPAKPRQFYILLQ